MPLVEVIEPTPFVKVGLWAPGETDEEMLARLGTERAAYAEQLDKLSALKRRREFLSVRLLLDHLTPEKKEMGYDRSGAPVLTDRSAFISVSHTDGCVAVGISRHGRIGIDVEKLSGKACRLRERFLNEPELAMCEKNNRVPVAVLLWSAKESLFKALGAREVDFRKHLHIRTFDVSLAGGIVTAQESRTPLQGVYRIAYRFYPDFVLTVCSRLPGGKLA